MEKLFINILTSVIRQIYYQVIYAFTLWKLRIVSKFRKIKVGFWVTEPAKWVGEHLYKELYDDDHFEPFILLSHFSKPQDDIDPIVFYNNAKLFFTGGVNKEVKEGVNNGVNRGVDIIEVFNPEKYEFKDLNSFKPDIIFYQQPWQINKLQRPERTHKKALLCYIPYCFYSINSKLNYLDHFQAIMWKYFVETDLHKKEYEKKYFALNCVTTGSAKLDEYHYANKEAAETFWKTKDKKRIIYAPHHSFNDGMHELATFEKNGKFILELAKSHPETEWIFRPHPVFVDRIIKNSIMTKEEIENYFIEWENIGTVSKGGNYYEMFLSSDLLITDCISFLTEYAPTLKPVIHLRKDSQKEDFNNLVQQIDKSYYQVYNNDELEKVFNRILSGDDFLKNSRKNNLSLLPLDNLASKNIFNYIKKSLWI